jgi:hypothetical protein
MNYLLHNFDNENFNQNFFFIIYNHSDRNMMHTPENRKRC